MRCPPCLALVCTALFFGASGGALTSHDFGSSALTAGPIGATLTLQLSGAHSQPNVSLRYGKDFSLGQVTCNSVACTVTVSFAPTFPGVRQDAVLVLDGGSGTLLAAELLHGIGLAPQAVLRPGTITSFAGTGTLGNSGDNGPASSAALRNPQGNGGPAVNSLLGNPSSVALDSVGNLYIADSGNNLIRKVTANGGIISVVAGNGAAAYSGDGGAALEASLSQPASVRVDAAGNLYISDSHNHAIRQVNGAGIISTVARQLNNPGGIALDPAGNVYIADQGNSKVWKLAPGPAALTFPDTSVGNISPQQTVSVANIGNQLLNIGGFNLTGSFLQQSSGVTDCSSDITVAAAASCSVSVVFAPPSSSSFTGTLWLLTNASTISLAMNGTGTGGAISDPSVNTSSLSFGTQAAGTTSPPQTVTLTNGSAQLTFTGISISGSDFLIAGTTCQSPLPPNAYCTVSITFKPLAVGPSSATLLMTEATGATQFSQSVLLSG